MSNNTNINHINLDNIPSNERLNFNEAEKNIVHKYSKIYKFTFKYFIYIIIGLISIIILNNNINKTQNLSNTDNFIVEKAKLIGEFNKITNQNIDNPDIKVYILQGPLEITGDLIFSSNNLIAYKHITMPRNIFLYNNSDIKDKTYFEQSGGNYDINELENFAQNILFTNSDQIEKSTKKTISLPLDESLQKTFYLKCTKQPKIIHKTCDHYINNFLNTFYIYDIPKDYQGLQDIFQALKSTSYKTDICNAMKKYILYSNDTNEQIENIFISCGGNYYNDFHDIQLFLDIQDQLKKGYINQTIYQNPILNAYKLLSYQQIIYNDLHQSTVNNIRFETYINFLSEILKKDNKIDKFYLDLTYRFNNNYVIHLLNRLKYKVTDNKKTEIENIVKNLNKINNGDELVGYAGLKTKLLNNNLQTHTTKDILSGNIIPENGLKKLMDSIKSLSFFKVIREKTAGDKIKINGYFSIDYTEGTIPLYVSIIVKESNEKLIVESINIIEGDNINKFDDLNKTLKIIIQDQEYTIPEIYQYIQENINIFLSDDMISTCDSIANMISSMQDANKDLSLELLDCSPEKIAILKNEKQNNTNYKTYYKLTLENFDILNIMISNKYIENEILKYLDSLNTNNITITNIVQEILNYKIKDTTYVQQGSNNIIITIEDFEKYLGITPKDIVEGNNQIITEFEIQQIKFIGNYNIDNKKLGPLYFKYNSQNQQDNKNNISKEDLKINNFELYLKGEYQNNINEFLIDPLKYINKINPQVVTNYNNLKYK